MFLRGGIVLDYWKIATLGFKERTAVCNNRPISLKPVLDSLFDKGENCPCRSLVKDS